MTETWLKEYSTIVETHESKVAKGEVVLEEFDTAEELFTYLNKQ